MGVAADHGQQDGIDGGKSGYRENYQNECHGLCPFFGRPQCSCFVPFVKGRPKG
jgi:hypothetical protein